MSRKAIIVFLLVYFFIAFAASILWELATPAIKDGAAYQRMCPHGLWEVGAAGPTNFLANFLT
jgi:hypothetical protein